MRQVLVDAGRRRTAGKRLPPEDRLDLVEVSACFTGLRIPRDISERTVQREWRMARTWLRREPEATG